VAEENAEARLTGEWLRRREELAPHRCPTPTRELTFTRTPDGRVGDVWRCACRSLWVVKYRDGGRVWREADALGPVWWRYRALPALGELFTSLVRLRSGGRGD
jgi:hypothetical protein